MAMIVIDYDVRRHKEVVRACVHALRLGKIVAYPTDTSYGLACDTGGGRVKTRCRSSVRYYK
jgi:tRNA A37 threonylcarbamoyladenosine synthetase subunit TsaC/SUA5/YrdC